MKPMQPHMRVVRCVQSPADMAFDAIVDLAAFAPGDRPDTRSPEQVAEEVPDSELAKSSMGGFFKFAQACPGPSLAAGSGVLGSSQAGALALARLTVRAGHVI